MDFQSVRLSSVLEGFIQRVIARNLNIKIIMNVQNSQNTIVADSGRLVQVFENLVNNAVKYAAGTQLAITLEWELERAHIIFEDGGQGIPNEHLEDIFKRFYRLTQHRDSASGTGLGLFICHEIMQAHEGTISAESTVGKGAAFHLYLPRENLSDGGDNQ